MTTIKRPKGLIKDKLFKAQLDFNASSKNPARACWIRANACVSENFTLLDAEPADPLFHFFIKQDPSVLNGAFATIHVGGFDHGTVMQLSACSHNDILVQSMSSIGRRMLNSSLDVDSLFYIKDNSLLTSSIASRKDYASAINNGMGLESSKHLLAANYRQNFTMSGNVKSWLHTLDQILPKATRIESQSCAWLIFDQLYQWWPDLLIWYLDNARSPSIDFSC